MPFLDDNIKSKEKRQNFKICKPIFLCIFIFFSTIFCLFFILVTKNRFIMILAPAHDHKCPLRSLVLKTDVTLVQTLRLIILDVFTGKSFSSDRRMYLDAIIWQ